MIPFVDLGAQYRVIQPQVEDAVLRVLRSGQYILGPEVEALEDELASFAGVPYCVTCASGTDALVIALMAKGVGVGDAIFTTPFTFMASAEAIALVGATPVFVDIDGRSFNMDPAKLHLAVDKCRAAGALEPKGIIPVDLFGLPADYSAIHAVAEHFGLFVIADAAQSFGARIGNRPGTSLSEVACTSFFPAKPLGCYGDGGAVFTSDAELDSLFRSIRVHGQGSDRYEHVRLGITGRLDAIQAAILRIKLAAFERELEDRQRIAAEYNIRIADAGLELVTPFIPEGMRSAWAQYSLLAANAAAREAVRTRLGENGVPTAIYYPKPLHLQHAFADLGHKEGDFPVSEEVGSRIFSLPMHPYLASETIAHIVDSMRG